MRASPRISPHPNRPGNGLENRSLLFGQLGDWATIVQKDVMAIEILQDKKKPLGQSSEKSKIEMEIIKPYITFYHHEIC